MRNGANMSQDCSKVSFSFNIFCSSFEKLFLIDILNKIGICENWHTKEKRGKFSHGYFVFPPTFVHFNVLCSFFCTFQLTEKTNIYEEEKKTRQEKKIRVHKKGKHSTEKKIQGVVQKFKELCITRKKNNLVCNFCNKSIKVNNSISNRWNHLHIYWKSILPELSHEINSKLIRITTHSIVRIKKRENIS